MAVGPPFLFKMVQKFLPEFGPKRPPRKKFQPCRGGSGRVKAKVVRRVGGFCGSLLYRRGRIGLTNRKCRDAFFELLATFLIANIYLLITVHHE